MYWVLHTWKKSPQTSQVISSIENVNMKRQQTTGENISVQLTDPENNSFGVIFYTQFPAIC